MVYNGMKNFLTKKIWVIKLYEQVRINKLIRPKYPENQISTIIRSAAEASVEAD